MAIKIYSCVRHGEIPAEDVETVPGNESGQKITIDPTEHVLDAYTPPKRYHKGCGMPVEVGEQE